ncbi:hypothetical protein THS27_13500, partial [Thalassospira sp. MCCC 1A01428]
MEDVATRQAPLRKLSVNVGGKFRAASYRPTLPRSSSQTRKRQPNISFWHLPECFTPHRNTIVSPFTRRFHANLRSHTNGLLWGRPVCASKTAGQIAFINTQNKTP